MALQLVVDDLETVPEPLRANYKEADGKYRLDLEGYEDPAGLKSALEKERKAAREASKQVTAWQSLGKTPEEIQTLLEAQRKADEASAEKNGEWDKLKAQMLEQHTRERETLEAKAKAKDAAIERHLIDAQATAAIAEAKGVPALLLPHVKASVRVVEEDGEYAVRVVDGKGNPRVNGKGDYLSIADLVGEMRQSDVFGRAFDADGRTGGGAGPSSAGGAKVITQAAFDALPPKQRAAKMAEGYRIAT